MTASDHGLTSDRFLLRPLSLEDLEDLKGILADPDIVKMLLGDSSTAAGLDLEARRWIDPPETWAACGYGSWGLYDRSGQLGQTGQLDRKGALLGLVAAGPPLLPESAGPEIFYFLGKACRGKGVAREAVIRMCRYLFEDLGAPALEATIFAELNPGSVGLATRLGLRPVGRVSLRDHGLDDARLRELLTFDRWRVTQASPENLEAVLQEAAFRIGQTLAEGVSSQAAEREALTAACQGKGLELDRLGEVIEQRLSAGMAAPGMALYRVLRKDFTP